MPDVIGACVMVTSALRSYRLNAGERNIPSLIQRGLIGGFFLAGLALHDTYLIPPLYHSVDILLDGIGMIFLHGPFLLELLPMFSNDQEKAEPLSLLDGFECPCRIVQIRRGSGGCGR